jgi:hypothetical protein
LTLTTSKLIGGGAKIALQGFCDPREWPAASLLRHVAFTGKIKTASEYLSAYISDRTGGDRVA